MPRETRSAIKGSAIDDKCHRWSRSRLGAKTKLVIQALTGKAKHFDANYAN